MKLKVVQRWSTALGLTVLFGIAIINQTVFQWRQMGLVIDEGPSEGDGTGTELDGPGLSAEEMAQAMATSVDEPRPTDETSGEGEDGGEKKGFFKKLFG